MMVIVVHSKDGVVAVVAVVVSKGHLCSFRCSIGVSVEHGSWNIRHGLVQVIRIIRITVLSVPVNVNGAVAALTQLAALSVGGIAAAAHRFT